MRPNFFSSGRIFLAELAQESWRDLAAVISRSQFPGPGPPVQNHGRFSLLQVPGEAGCWSALHRPPPPAPHRSAGPSDGRPALCSTCGRGLGPPGASGGHPLHRPAQAAARSPLISCCLMSSVQESFEKSHASTEESVIEEVRVKRIVRRGSSRDGPA